MRRKFRNLISTLGSKLLFALLILTLDKTLENFDFEAQIYKSDFNTGVKTFVRFVDFDTGQNIGKF